MSKKTITLTPAVNKNKLLSRDLIWMAIRKLKEFSLLDIEAHARLPDEKQPIPESTIKDYLKGLRLSGHLEYTVAPARYTKVRWKLIKDIGVERPYVNKFGKTARSTTSQMQIWRALKVISGVTDVCSLKHHASTDEHEVTLRQVRYFVRWLHKAGYLVLKRKGVPSETAKYQVVKSKVKGPRPPMILSSHQVFDANNGEIVYIEDYEEKE